LRFSRSFLSNNHDSPIIVGIKDIIERYPNKKALSVRGKTWTYQELANRINHFAQMLDDVSAEQNSILPIYSVHPQEIIFTFLAAMGRGLKPLIVDTDFTKPGQVGPFVKLKPDWQKKIGQTKSGANIACYFFSSASTGLPKLVAQDSYFLWADCQRQITEHQWHEKSVIDLCFSLSHSAMLASLLPSLLCGAQLVLWDPKKEGLSSIAHNWEKYGVQYSCLNTALFRRLCRDVGPFSNIKLQTLCLGAAMVNAKDLKLFEKNFPASCQVQISYASTEARSICNAYLAWGEPLPYRGWIGRPVEGRNIIIEKNNEKAKLILTWPNRWGLQEKKEILLDDRLRPRGQGHFQILGRTSNLVRIGSHWLDLDLIEEQIYALNISEKVAIWVEEEVLLFALLDGAESQGQTNWQKELKILDRLPHKVFWLSEWFYTHSGKTDLSQLKKRVQDLKTKVQFDSSPELKRMISHWERFLKQSPIHAESHFFYDLGQDSLQAQALQHYLEASYLRKLPRNFIIKAPSPKLALALYTEDQPLKSYQLICFNSCSAGPDLIIIGQAEALDYYHQLANRLAEFARVHLLSISLPRLVEKAEPNVEWRQIFNEALLEAKLEPKVILGHSVFGWLAVDVGTPFSRNCLFVLVDPYYELKHFTGRLGLRIFSNGVWAKVALRYCQDLRLAKKELSKGLLIDLERAGQAKNRKRWQQHFKELAFAQVSGTHQELLREERSQEQIAIAVEHKLIDLGFLANTQIDNLHQK
jgi:acyl-CoA synthetase (AMP-forming)/AMP-acid ligase II